jgi:hypothetical protein
MLRTAYGANNGIRGEKTGRGQSVDRWALIIVSATSTIRCTLDKLAKSTTALERRIALCLSTLPAKTIIDADRWLVP